MIHRIVSPPLAANVYFIDDEKKAVIDTGGDATFLVERLRKFVNPKEIDYIILTHSHFDHAAATADLKRICGAKILIHPEEYEFVKSVGFSTVFFNIKYPPFSPDVEVGEGDYIDLGELSFKVLHTPGHTPGSICLYEENEKILFSGDTVFPNGAFGRVDLPGGNARDLIQSLKRLASLDVEIMYPGHENPVKNASEHIKLSYRIASSFL